MTRQHLRNRYPLHGQPSRPEAPRATYNRHSLQHRSRAFLARLRRLLGVKP